MELNEKIDPIKLFKKWFEKAQEKELSDPNAMQIATVSKNGFPSVRTVLMKDIIDGNFVFYTNYKSRKSEEIFETNPMRKKIRSLVITARNVRTKKPRLMYPAHEK